MYVYILYNIFFFILFIINKIKIIKYYYGIFCICLCIFMYIRFFKVILCDVYEKKK